MIPSAGRFRNLENQTTTEAVEVTKPVITTKEPIPATTTRATKKNPKPMAVETVTPGMVTKKKKKKTIQIAWTMRPFVSAAKPIGTVDGLRSGPIEFAPSSTRERKFSNPAQWRVANAGEKIPQITFHRSVE